LMYAPVPAARALRIPGVYRRDHLKEIVLV